MKSGRNGRNDGYYRKRPRDDEWNRSSPSYGNRPKKKPQSGERRSSFDRDYPDAPGMFRIYNRDEMRALAAKPAFDKEKIEDLSLKFDLVFDISRMKPAFEEPATDTANDQRFAEPEIDKDERPTRDYKRDRDNDYNRKPKSGESPANMPSVENKKGKTKEFVKFDDFAKSLGFDSKTPASRDGEKFKEEIVKTDNSRLPEQTKLAYNDVSSQKSPDLAKWPIKPNDFSAALRGDSEDEADEEDVEESPEEDNGDYNQNAGQYYAYNPATKRYNFFEELEEEEDQDDAEYERRPEEQHNHNQPTTYHQERKSSHDSGNLQIDQVGDITSLWKQMKEEDARAASKPPVDPAIVHEEDILGTVKDHESLNKLLSTFTVKGNQAATESKSTGVASHPNQQHSRLPHGGELFGSIKSTTQKQTAHNNAVGSPIVPNEKLIVEKEVVDEPLSDEKLQSLLGTFAEGGKKKVQPTDDVALLDPAIAGTKTEAPEVELIEGPPPSVAKKVEEQDPALEKKKKDFQEKYFAMDRALCQVVYDTLNSKRRYAIDMYSTNGITQITVEKYCANNFKIFTFLMQGDVFSKVWLYKDKVGTVLGPYMSFDMDIWNGEGTYFAKNLLISPNGKDYFPLSSYLDRDEEILELMQTVVEKQQQNLDKAPSLLNMLPKVGVPPQPWFPKGMTPGNIPLMPIPNNKQGYKRKDGDQYQKKPYQNNRQQPLPQFRQEDLPGLLAALAPSGFQGFPLGVPGMPNIPPFLQPATQKWPVPVPQAPFIDPAIQGFSAPPTDDLITGDDHEFAPQNTSSLLNELKSGQGNHFMKGL